MTLPVDEWHKRLAVVGYGLVTASVRRRIRPEDLGTWACELKKLSVEIEKAQETLLKSPTFTSLPTRRNIDKE